MGLGRIPGFAIGAQRRGRALAVVVAVTIAASIFGPRAGWTQQAVFVTPTSSLPAAQPQATTRWQDGVITGQPSTSPLQGSGGNAEANGSPWRTLLVSAAAAFCVALLGTSYECGHVASGPTPAWADSYRGTAGSGMKANRDPVSLLQLALPLEETLSAKVVAPVRLLQESVEALREQAQLRMWGQLNTSLEDAKAVYTKDRKNLLKPIVKERQAEAEDILNKLGVELQKLDKEASAAVSAGYGTAEDVEGTGKVVEYVKAAQQLVGQLEELMVPPGYEAPVPSFVTKYFGNVPKLNGRATVEMVVKRGPDSKERKYAMDGVRYDQVNLKIIVDGWSAPLSAGNFVDLVNKGFYDGKAINRADGFVIQTGDGGSENKGGYIPEGSSKLRKVPLEVGLRGEKEALYGETVDEAGKVGIPIKIPFQADGTLAMARKEFDPDSASSQFFFFLFESDMTPAGKNFLDGRYSTFGYTLDGSEFMRQIREGDVITIAKVTNGLDKLKGA